MIKHYINIKLHKDDSKIPEGKAILYLTNSGFVGTNNGYPLTGQPALYPEDQALAIYHIWTYMQMYHPNFDEMPHPECIPLKVLRWIK